MSGRTVPINKRYRRYFSIAHAAPSASQWGGDHVRGGLHAVRRVSHRYAEPGPAQHGNVVFAVANGDGLLARNAEKLRGAGQSAALVHARRHDLQRFRAGREAVDRTGGIGVQFFPGAPDGRRQAEQQYFIYPFARDRFGGGQKPRRARGTLRVDLRGCVFPVGVDSAAAVDDGGACPPPAPAEQRERVRLDHESLGKRFPGHAALHQRAVSENERHVAGEKLSRDLGAAAEPPGGERYEFACVIYGADRRARMCRYFSVGMREREIVIGGHQSVCHENRLPFCAEV